MKNAILVVHRNPSARSTLARILEDEGHQVVSAEDGDAAAAVSRRVRPVLMLVDARGPFESGEGVLEEVQERLRDETPIAIVLATSEGEQRRARALGATASFCKPFPVEALLAAVRAHMTR